MIPGQANWIISSPVRQLIRRVRSNTYSRSVRTNATLTATSEAMRIPFTPRCQTATSRTVKRICVRPRERVEGKPAPLAPQPCEVHGEVDDVREIDVDERDREERGVGLNAEDPVGEAGGEDDEREDDERWIDRLDQQVERDDPPAPVRVVAVEVEPCEDAVHAGGDDHVDERDGREHELETPELRWREEVGVERDEEEREGLEHRAHRAVEGRVARKCGDAEPLPCIVVALAARRAGLDARTHGPGTPGA